MARDYTGRRLKAWVELLAIPGMRQSMLRQVGADFREAEINRAAKALGLDLSDATQMLFLLGVACECLFPTLNDNPFEAVEYRHKREPDKPLLEIWISGRMASRN
jgi:hypothetical protein